MPLPTLSFDVDPFQVIDGTQTVTLAFWRPATDDYDPTTRQVVAYFLDESRNLHPAGGGGALGVRLGVWLLRVSEVDSDGIGTADKITSGGVDWIVTEATLDGLNATWNCKVFRNN